MIARKHEVFVSARWSFNLIFAQILVKITTFNA